MLRGEPYLPGDPELADDRRRARLLVERLNATSSLDLPAIGRILDDLLGAVGLAAQVTPPLWCDYGFTIRIGARSFLNFGTVILDGAAVSIGDDVKVGPGVQLLTATHPLDAAARRDGWETAEPISVGDGAWLGGGVIVCPGVSIGADAVVGAGSVVTRDVPAGHLAYGNPCRVVRDLSPAARSIDP
ncbi:MAG TPA: sugar O-acetyltransferase [Solirubrobacteraceae bacterium]|jgi:maltose O-acetyltransferase|nr:sugar O-acetyltransferase [Solirubrobacteraceae bacterium]